MSTQASPIVQIVGGTFDAAAHSYFNAEGKERPSTTQILDGVGLVNLDDIPGDTLERKRQIGDSVHVATHFLDQDDLNWDTVEPECVGYVLAWENAKEQCGIEILGIEQGGISAMNGMEFGYTRDRIARVRGIKYRCVVEIKCAYKEEKAWRYQLASYIQTVEKEKDEYIARIAVQLKKNGSFKLYPYENPRDVDVFRAALYLTHVKINDGMKWKRDRL